MAFDYNQYAPRGGGGNYMKFEQQGDRIAGTVTATEDGSDFDGKPCPKLTIRQEDGTEKTVTAGQTILHDKIIEAAPQVGDGISISFVGMKGQAKDFDVQVNRANAQATPAPVAAVPEAPAAPAPAGDLAPPALS